MVSTAQHLTDLAIELTKRGHSVTVLTSDRGYDDPNIRFKRREEWKGITILRMPSLSWGKQSRWKRAANFFSFLFICSLRLLFLGRFDTVVALTSPPLISFLAALYVQLKGGRLCCWIMDLNPDEAIAAGWLRRDSFASTVFARMMNYSLRRADHVVVLDRFMKDRITARGLDATRISVVRPWSHSDQVHYSSTGRNVFRQTHGLHGKFVVMYSGNHSPCHPLDTLLAAALDLRTREEIAFCFIGGGSEYGKVHKFATDHDLKNIKCIPYQPLNNLSASLSAADLQVVIVGDPFVGIVHPCKVYNILTIGTRILYIGPEESHVTDLIPQLQKDQLVSARHGEAKHVVNHILTAFEYPADTPVGESGDKSTHSKEFLLPQLCKVIERDGSDLQTHIAQEAVT